MNTNLSENLCEDVFMYGNHMVNITIDVVSESNDFRDKGCTRFLHKYAWEFDMFRKVTIAAWTKGDKPDSLENAEIYSEVYAALDTSQETKEKRVSTGIFTATTETVTEGQKPIPVREHVQKSVEPVFERLDKFYEFSHKNVDIDIDVTMDEIISETSWVDIETKTEEITSSIDRQLANAENGGTQQ